MRASRCEHIIIPIQSTAIRYMLNATSLPRGYALRCNIVAMQLTLYSKSLNPTLLISRCSSVWERVRTVILRLQVWAHCAPLFFFQQCSLVGIHVFTGEDPQSEWLKSDESNRVYWFQTRLRLTLSLFVGCFYRKSPALRYKFIIYP